MMNKNTSLYYKSARDLGLSVVYIPEIFSLRIPLGGKNYFFSDSVTPLNVASSIFLAKNKFSFNTVLHDAGFPVPKAIAISRPEFKQRPIEDLVATLSFPLVAKPLIDTARGKDVLCNIKNHENLTLYLSENLPKYPYIFVEEFHRDLKEYRVLVLKNRVIGVVERFAAYLTGDGYHNIGQLIELKNKQRVLQGKELSLSPLIMDEEYKKCLEEQELSVESIPAKDQHIRLCYTVNTGRGGEVRSRGKKIHAHNAKYLVAAAKVVGLNFVGFDVLCEDLNRSFKDSKWLILEGNYNPDITIHEKAPGKKERVTKKVLKQLIFRHPFSYCRLWLKNHRYSFYFKACLIIACVLSTVFLSGLIPL